ncbi:MAG: DUF3341 domain-containing protein [Ignavibacteria bacterium]|nr:DUF3341 domain-containing protein [Ignavibacteria bacterium]
MEANSLKSNLYGVSAIFSDTKKIAEITHKVAELGYKNYDVHSSFPIHNLPKKMKLKWSPLGYIAFVLGISGAAFGLFLTWWTMSVDYPLIIGGKPWFSFPAFVPVLFELTVLLASVGTAIVMLFIIFKFPNPKHPLHDTEYMKRVSVDGFGIVIEAKDEKFDYEKIRSLFSEFGAEKIFDIYYSPEELNYKPKVFEPKFIVFLIFLVVLTAFIGYFVNNKLFYMPPFDFMLYQFRVNPQEESTLFADGFAMRPPVKGTVARGQSFYQFKGQPEEAAANLINPLLPTEQTLALGQKKFNTFCSPCHGWRGEGDSRLNQQFPNPPSLHTDKVRNWTDGRIYHIITEGQNIMPSYASQLSEEERWAIILYIRALQRSLNAKLEDVQ